ncbi:MAG TPA: DUF1761 domain-containing protein [Candidatus Nanoarchaeia archaeon]|nr:DUF1761 domain-containing protein [Candidatus Nanoarchaeia archaeon]
MAEIIVNYWAVLCAAISGFVIGWIWYGPLFGRQWAKLMKFTSKGLKKMKMTPAKAMTFGFVSVLVTAYVLAHFVNLLNLTNWGGAAQFAFWAWLGLVAPVQFGAFLWEGKPLKLFLLNTAHNLVVLIVMSGILAIWR